MNKETGILAVEKICKRENITNVIGSIYYKAYNSLAKTNNCATITEEQIIAEALKQTLSEIKKFQQKEIPTKEIECQIYGNNKNKSRTQKLINELYKAALEFYGKEYEEKLKQTIRNTAFYECEKNETCVDVQEKLLKTKFPKDYKKEMELCCGMACTLKNGQAIIIFKDIPPIDYRANLVHELFYHQFTRQSNFVVENSKGEKFYRDGISLTPQQKGLRENEALNEGFAEYITTQIMQIYTKNKSYRPDPRRIYEPLQEYAEQIAACYNKEEIIKMITTGNPTIEELTQTEGFDFSTFSGYLDVFLKSRDTNYLKIAELFFLHFREKHTSISNQKSFSRKPILKTRNTKKN